MNLYLTKPIALKTLTIITILTVPFWALVSCQSKPGQTVFQSTQIDSPTDYRNKIYKLKKKVTNSDFNYSKLNNIDDYIGDTLTLNSLMPIFEPTGGHFVYYQFLATFKGHIDVEVGQNFHDILIVKTDPAGKIVDAYQYTLEWGEMPLQFDVYKSTAQNVILKNDLNISSLHLMRKDFPNEKERVLEESGRLQLQ
jgi:hypothetical protein